MKSKIIIASILILYCLTTSLQCSNCGMGDIHLDATRSWLPLKDKTELMFLDNTGGLAKFSLRTIDTTETAYDDCGNPYRYEYIKTSLFLNSGMSDSIHFNLGSGGSLCMTAAGDRNLIMSICDVFGQTKEGIVAKKLSDYIVGNKKYREVVLIEGSPGNSDIIDSVFIANNIGYVGFKYLMKKYTLR